MKKSPKTHRRLNYGDFYNHRISAAGYSEVISKFTVKQPWPKVGVFTSFPMNNWKQVSIFIAENMIDIG